MNALKIHNISFSYGEHRIFENLSFEVAAGERVCLNSASGSGKTTLLRLIAGLETSDSGEISREGEIFYLFQEDRLLPHLSAAENLRFVGASRDEAVSALEAVGIADFADARPSELSGGMRRRVALARLCCFGNKFDKSLQKKSLLLLDEPFTGLDAESRECSARAIALAFPRTAAIIATHSPDEAALLGASRILRL